MVLNSFYFYDGQFYNNLQIQITIHYILESTAMYGYI